MKKFYLLPLMVAALSLGALCSVKASNLKVEERDAEIIVQLNDNVETKSVDALLNKQDAVLATIKEGVTSNIRVKTRFTNVFNGFTLEVPSSYVTQIRNIPSVKRVNYNELMYKTDNDEVVTLTKKNALNIESETANVSKETMEVPDGSKEGEGILIAILDTGGYLYYDENGARVQHETYSELEAGTKLKIKDEATLKSLVDGAPTFHGKYDRTHSTYWNNKVPFYYDYGGDVNERNTIGKEDFDVFAKEQEHGTHVASIAAGNAPSYKGIAPKAQIAVMKVFTCYTPTAKDAEDGYTPSAGAYPDALLKALEDCAVLGVDIVNMSLGSTLNDFDNDSIVNAVITKLQKDGMYISHAAGNDGKYTFKNSAYEYWTTNNIETGILSSYSNNSSTIEIAAAQADREFYESAFIVGNNTVSFRDQIESYNGSSGEVVYDPEYHLTDLINDPAHSDGMFEWFKVPGLGDDADYDGLDDDCLEGKIAIIDRGDITFVKKITNAKDHGAIAVGIIDNDPTNTDFSFRMDLSGWNPGLPVVMLLYRDKPVFDNATEFTAKIVVNEIAVNPSARQMTSFSSDGATFDLQLKPDIATPGQNILGAINDETNSYEYFNGTSMATPNYCGVLAVMMSEHLNDENYADYRQTINARLMSTAVPMFDANNVLEGQEKAYASVRKQGSGLVNANAALNSKIYLDGSLDTNKLSNYAKIELKNNAKIAEGKIDLSFSIINETDTAVNYTATTYIYRPDLVTLDEENYPEFKDVKLQSTDNHLIAKVDNNVTAQAGTSVIELPEYEISDEEKTVLNENFPNGTYLEGFVFLKAENGFTLSIPFLGFYGDYSKGEPVEPFRFEREEGKTYASDLLNSIVHKWKGLQNADFASDWVVGNYDKFADVGIDDALKNDKSLRQLVDGNTNLLIPATTNPYTGLEEGNDIYVGNNGYANTMIIQQFVLRSCATNTITFKNKATGEVVLTDHMYDDLFGSKEDDNGNEIAWPLYKSQVDTSYWSNNLIAHRAYTLIPLYSMDNEKNKIADFPDGEYEMKFSYTLAAGGTYERTYTIHIDSKAPKIKSISQVNVAGVDYIRVRYEEDQMSYVIFNGEGKNIQKDDNGYYFDVLLEGNENGFFLRGYDFSSAYTNSIIGKAENSFMSITNPNANSLFTFTASVTDTSATRKTIDLAFKKDGKNSVLAGSYDICLELFPDMDAQYIRIYQVDGKGNETLVKSEVNNGFVNFGISTKKFVVDSTPYVAVNSVSLNKSELNIEVGETFDLVATVLPAEADQTINWTSSNKSVATVANGKITAKKAGTTTITAASPEFVQAECVVTVTAATPVLKSISVSGAPVTFNEGDTFTYAGLVVTATYSDNSTKTITSGYEVDSSAVNMNLAGTYTVKVTFEGKEASYTITVNAKQSSSSSEIPSSSTLPPSSSESSSIPSSSESSSSLAPTSSSSSSEASSSSTPDTPAPANKGCGGSITASVSLIAIVSLIGGAVALLSKKKEK